MKVSVPVTIKVEPGTANPPPPIIKKHYNIFIVVYKLLDTVHTDQTGAFPIMSQQGYRYIMVCIHLDKLHLLQNNKKPNQRQNDHGIPKDGQQDEALGTWVKTSPFGQRVFSSIQSIHHKGWDDPQASSPGLPPLQHHRIGCPNIQEPLCLHPQWGGG